LTLTRDIDLCKECLKFESRERINPSEKPYVKYRVEEKWQRKPTEILFIAESPPWNGKQRYFYNQDIDEKRTNLRKEVLEHLALNSLDEFKGKNFALIDAIKCRLNKSRKKSVPLKVIESCSARFLRREILALDPKVIFVLGNSAKQGLKQLPEFRDLKNHKATDDYDKMLSGYRVILCVYPGGQTRQHKNKIRLTFSKICSKT